MAGHSATIGMTGSGKSTLERARAAEFKRRGFGVLVLDPWTSPDWSCDFISDELDAFLRVVKRSRRCALFVEEAGDFGRDPRFAWLFTQARHWGHITHYVSQYHAQVPPIVRTNCERLHLFRVAQRSADVWADDFAQADIADLAGRLDRYQYVSAGRYGAPRVCMLRLST
ncbi:MAG: hypothetical protein ACREIA_16810 [Opitutaceae bacterium]